MLSPACDRCGCRLDARLVDTAAVTAAPTFVIPPWGPALARRLLVVLGALALYAASNLGYQAAGAAGAMIAFGVGGFLMLPFVPERLES
jgi:hypothetical protein